MLVAFWGNEKNIGVTSNLMALAVMSVLGSDQKIIMMENHRNYRGIAKGMFGSYLTEFLREEDSFYYVNGSSANVIKRFSNLMHRRVIDSVAIEVIKNGLYYYWQDFMVTDELFDYQFFSDYFLILEQASLIADLCFLDTKSTNTLSTKEILDIADVVIVNLAQDLLSVDSFFHNYYPLLEKSILLFSKYKKSQEIELDYYLKKFNVNPRWVTAIPSCGGFRNAVEDGRVIEFLSEHYDCGEEDEYWNFIYCLKKVYECLFAFIKEGRNSCHLNCANQPKDIY